MAVLTEKKVLYTVAFLDLLACSLVVPVLAPYLKSLGASHFTIGSLMSLYFGLQLISSPVIKHCSGAKNRLFILQITLLACSVFYFILGTTSVLPVVFLCRIVLGMFKHTQTLCGTMLAEVVPPVEQLEMQRMLTSFGTLGFVAGPAIAGNMLELHHGYQHVCYLVTVIFLINFAIVNTFLPNSSHEHRNKEGDSAVKSKTSSSNVKDKKNMELMSSIRKAKEHDIRRKSLSAEILQSVTDLLHINWAFYWDVFALKFLFDFTQTVHLMNFAPVLRDVYSTAPRWIGYTVALQGMAGTMSSFLTEWINILYKCDTSYTQRGLHGFGLFTLSFLCLSLAPNWTYMFIFLFPLSISMSLLKSTTVEMVRQRAVLDKKMAVIGLGQSVFSAARLFAPVCTGVIYDMYGFQGTSVLKIVAAGIATALSYFIFLRQGQDKKNM